MKMTSALDMLKTVRHEGNDTNSNYASNVIR